MGSGGVQIGQVGSHGRDIQHRALEIRMGLHPAVRDCKTAVCQADHLVGTDTTRRQLADALVAVFGIPDTQTPIRHIIGVLGGQQQTAIRGKGPVAVKVTPLGTIKPRDLCACCTIQHHGEPAWPAGKSNRLGAERMGRRRMTP